MPESFESLKTFLSTHAGIVLKEHQRYHIERKVTPVMEEYGCQSVESLLGLATHNSMAMRKLVALFTINETSFFRDIKVFNYLKSTLLPQLINERERIRDLSILSAASSSGQEAYSLAMTLYDTFPDLHTWNVSITGVDIDMNMVQKANDGWYSQLEVNRGLPTRSLLKHFERDNRGYRARPHLKQWVHFRLGNLFAPDALSRRYSLVCLRNVLIYFSDEDQHRLLRSMHSRLHKHGILLLGASEIGRQIPTDLFERKQEGNVIWYQVIS